MCVCTRASKKRKEKKKGKEPPENVPKRKVGTVFFCVCLICCVMSSEDNTGEDDGSKVLALHGVLPFSLMPSPQQEAGEEYDASSQLLPDLEHNGLNTNQEAVGQNFVINTHPVWLYVSAISF